MFHVELRKFPNVARAFNLTREELERRFLAPWVAGQPVEWDDRRWEPERGRITIYEGPQLRTDQIGLGRGWSNVIKSGVDVTEPLIGEAQAILEDRLNPARRAAEELRREILDRCAAGELAIHQALSIAGEHHPDWRVSDRMALAEQAVWELLHQQRLRMLRRAGNSLEVVPAEQWQVALLAWETWAGTPSSEGGSGGAPAGPASSEGQLFLGAPEPRS